MFDQDKEAAESRWYGVQEAANYLGVHRATLFRALRSGLIMADWTTPKGRARFQLATLNAFRDQLRRQAATSQAHAYAPMLVLAKLAGLGRSPAPAEDSNAVMDETVRLLCSEGGAFDMACIALCVPNDTDDFALKVLAECGFPERLKAAYEYLRPDTHFPANISVRTGSIEICDDLGAQVTPHETARRVMMQSNIFSYAVYPIFTGPTKDVLGALVVCGNAPHHYSEQDRLFLAGVADALSTCITRGSLNTSLTGLDPLYDLRRLTPDMTLGIVSRLLDTAYSWTRCPDLRRSPKRSVEDLCNLVVEQSHALTIWAHGFPPQGCGNTPDPPQEDALLRQYRSNLQSLVQRARTADGLKLEQWQSKVTAMAIPVPMPCGEPGAIGAVWPGVRTEVAAEGVVLSTLASACSLVSQYASLGCD